MINENNNNNIIVIISFFEILPRKYSVLFWGLLEWILAGVGVVRAWGQVQWRLPVYFNAYEQIGIWNIRSSVFKILTDTDQWILFQKLSWDS